MQIASVPLHDRAVHPVHAQTQHQKKQVDADPAATAADTPVVAEAEIDEGSERTPGVIRHLESGHFRGVADVRLRINFHDTLAARAEARTDAAVEKGAGAVVESVREGLGALGERLAVDDEDRAALAGLLGDFSDLVDGLGQTMGEQALRDGFGKLATEVRDMLAPERSDGSVATPVDGMPRTLDGSEVAPTDAPDDDVAVVIDPERAPVLAGEPTDQADAEARLDAAMGDLQAAFETAMNALMDSIHAASARGGPVSEPNGNGRAYEKFMAIYEQLAGGPGAVIAEG